MSERTGSPNERPRSVLLLLLQMLLSFVAGYVIFMHTFSATGCGDDRCSHTVWVTFIAMLWSLLLLFVASTAVVILRGLRQQPSWWAPMTAIAAIAVATAIATVVIRGAVAA